jgi:hypothetical protein
MAGNNLPTLLGNSINSGSSYYNTAYGNNVDMLLDDFVLVNEVYSAERIAALAADDADIGRSLLKVDGEFPETIYKDETGHDFPTFSTTVPNAKLKASASVKGGAELFSTPEPVDELDLNAVITSELLGNLPAGEYEVKVEVYDAISPQSALETKTFGVKVENSRTQTPKTATFAIAGPATATDRDEFDYKISLSDVENAGTVVVDLSYSDNLELVGATSLGDKLSIMQATDNYDGTARVTLWASVPGAMIADAEDIIKLTVKAKGEGAARVAIEDVTVNAYVAIDGEIKDAKKVDAEISEDEDAVDTEIGKYYDPYDFNRDGAVDLLDLTYAQIYYQVSEGDAKWTIVNERGMDVNGDKTVDLADLIHILDHIYSL